MLNTIKLINVGPHKNREFSFTDGKNIIIGKNGSGKSTIFTAIGIALFAYNDNSLKHIVNKNAETATIKLEFGGYTIIRDFGADSYYSLREGETEIANGRDQIIPYLQKILKLRVNPQIAFPNLIGVSQGTLRSLFLISPKGRKEVFDRLLGAYEYEHAWKGLKNSYGRNLLYDTKQTERDLITEINTLKNTRVTDLKASIKENKENLSSAQQKLILLNLQHENNKINLEQALQYTIECSKLNQIAANTEKLVAKIADIETTTPRRNLLEKNYTEHIIELEEYADAKIDWVNKI